MNLLSPPHDAVEERRGRPPTHPIALVGSVAELPSAERDILWSYFAEKTLNLAPAFSL